MTSDDAERLENFYEEIERLRGMLDESRDKLIKKFETHLELFPKMTELKEQFVEKHILKRGVSEADSDPEALAAMLRNEQVKCV